MKPEIVSYVAAAGAAATATFVLAKMFHHTELVTLQRQFTQSEDNVAQLVEEYGVQLQCKASMASELVELRDELAAAEEREAVLQQQLTESEEQRRVVHQQLDTVKNRVESLQGQLRVLQGALEEVAHSGSLQGLVLPLMPGDDGAGNASTTTAKSTSAAADGNGGGSDGDAQQVGDDDGGDADEARMQALAAATAAVLPGEVQRLRGQVVQLEAQCRLRDVEAGQLRASLSDLQRRHETALLDHAAAVTAATSQSHTPPTSTSELHMLKQEIQRLKRQLHIRHAAAASIPPPSSSRTHNHLVPTHLARCESDASDAASIVSTSSGRRVHRTPGVSSAFAGGASVGPGSTDDNDDSPTGIHSSSTASVGEPCCSGLGESGDATPAAQPLTPLLSEEPSIGMGIGGVGNNPSRHDELMERQHFSLHDAAYQGRRHSFSHAARQDIHQDIQQNTHQDAHHDAENTHPHELYNTHRLTRPPRPLSRSASGGVEMPERSISVRTSLQTWEALAALSAQGNKGLVVPSPRKLYWAGYKGVMLDDDH